MLFEFIALKTQKCMNFRKGPSPNLDPGTQPDPKSGSKRVNLGLLSTLYYRVEPEFEPFVRPTQPDWIRFCPLGPTRPDSTRILGQKSGST